MGTTIRRAEATVEQWHRRGWTTIVLETNGDGWRATQRGVDCEGHGETAVLAAADYCHRVEGDG